LFFTPILVKSGLITASLIYSIISIAGFLCIGTLVYHEHLTAFQITGVSIGIVAVILLSFEG